MFDILAKAESFASQTELLLDGVERGDEAGWLVGAEEVPGIEAGKVLEGTEELVAADCRGCGVISRIARVGTRKQRISGAIPVVATKRR